MKKTRMKLSSWRKSECKRQGEATMQRSKVKKPSFFFFFTVLNSLADKNKCEKK